MPDEQRIVIGGVDTHRDAHTAAAIDSAGRLLDTASFPSGPTGQTPHAKPQRSPNSELSHATGSSAHKTATRQPEPPTASASAT